jgi:ATP-dependent RNA helicase DeaD
MHLVKRVHNVEVDVKSIERYLPAVYEELNELTKEDLIRRFVSIEFNRFAEYYRNAPDLNMNAGQDERRASTPGAVKLYMNLGQMDGFDANSLKDFVADNAEINAQDITWTDVKNTFSLLEVRTGVMEQVMNAIHGAQYRGRTVRMESRGNRDEGIGRSRSGGGDRNYTRNRGGGGGGGDRKSYGGGDRDRKSYGSGGGGERRGRGEFSGAKKKKW